MYDIIIIGAGPAGLTAALYAKRRNKKVLVLEKTSYGGQIIETPRIENYPGIKEISGIDFATNLLEQVKNLDCEIKYEEVLKIKNNLEVETSKNIYQTKKIIIATGLEKRKLNIDNELNLIGNGISYCASCDGPFYKNKVVAVVGGGSTAMEDALYLSDICKKVYLIHRKDTFRGEEKYYNEILKKENIDIFLNSNIIKLNGKDKLESIEIQNKETIELNIDCLFIAIGHNPNTNIYKDIIELDEDGYIKTIDGIHTSNKNILVAGDVRTKKLRQLVTAVSDGAECANIAIEEMGKWNGSSKINRKRF